MAAPVPNTPSTGTCPASGSAATVTLSCDSPSAGDLLVVFLASGSGAGRKIDVPGGGWISVVDSTVSVSGADTNVQVMYKVAVGSETTQAFTAALSFGRMAGALFKITGAIDPATTAMVTSIGSEQTGGTLNFPSATPAADESLCFSFSGGSIIDGGESTTPPSGESEDCDLTTDLPLSVSHFTHNASAIAARAGSYLVTYRGRFAATVCLAPTVASGQPAGKRMGGVQFGNRNKGVW